MIELHFLEVLLALVEALVPINMLDSALHKTMAQRIKKAAQELVSLLEAFATAGAPLTGIMPRTPTDIPQIGDYARTLDFMAGMAGEAMTAERGAVAEFLYGRTTPSVTLDRALTNPDVLLALLRSLAEREIGAIRQRRGSVPQRRALTIARELRPMAGSVTAVAIANAATGARITRKAITKSWN